MLTDRAAPLVATCHAINIRVIREIRVRKLKHRTGALPCIPCFPCSKNISTEPVPFRMLLPVGPWGNDTCAA